MHAFVTRQPQPISVQSDLIYASFIDSIRSRQHRLPTSFATPQHSRVSIALLRDLVPCESFMRVLHRQCRLSTASARSSVVYRQHRYATGIVSSNVVYRQHPLAAASFTDSIATRQLTRIWFHASSSHNNDRFHSDLVQCEFVTRQR